MALIVMAVHDTEENGRTEYTRRTLESLFNTVDFRNHRLYISDNGSCAATWEVYREFADKLCAKLNPDYQSKGKFDTGFLFGEVSAWTLSILGNGSNLGTAKAVNKGLATRRPEEYCIKMDNDVVIHYPGWVDVMEDAMNRVFDIGVLGLKRKDLEQKPGHEDINYRSQLELLPQQKGQQWLVVEYARDIMGTCTMFNWRMLDLIGGLQQPGVYGWDDVDMCIRSKLAGFNNAFLPFINIDHIDVGGDSYCLWKKKHADQHGDERKNWEREYIARMRSLMVPI